MRVRADAVTTADTIDGVPVRSVAKDGDLFVWLFLDDGCALRCPPDDTVEVDDRETAPA